MITNDKGQGWQELHEPIENTFGHLLKDYIQRIEYKPQALVLLLEMPSEYREPKSS